MSQANHSNEPAFKDVRVGWSKDGAWIDGRKVSDASIDEALRLNAQALGSDPGAPAVVPGKEPS